MKTFGILAVIAACAFGPAAQAGPALDNVGDQTLSVTYQQYNRADRGDYRNRYGATVTYARRIAPQMTAFGFASGTQTVASLSGDVQSTQAGLLGAGMIYDVAPGTSITASVSHSLLRDRLTVRGVTDVANGDTTSFSLGASQSVWLTARAGLTGDITGTANFSNATSRLGWIGADTGWIATGTASAWVMASDRLTLAAFVAHTRSPDGLNLNAQTALTDVGIGASFDLNDNLAVGAKYRHGFGADQVNRRLTLSITQEF